jgi:predicted nucleic acid-binding protein
MTTYLLDVNVLIALSDPMHLHHDAAHRWFGSHGKESWATCPITENGFVRIASHPSYPNRPGDTPVVLSLLRQMCAVEGHHFWPDGITIC